MTFHPELDVASLLVHAPSMVALSKSSGLDRRKLHRRKHTGLTVDEAEQCAMGLLLHPSAVWGCWFDLLDAQRRAEHAAYMRKWRRTRKGRRSERNAQLKWQQSSREYMNAYQYKWRAANPERHRAIQRAYRERNREQLLARRRARYRAKKAA